MRPIAALALLAAVTTAQAATEQEIRKAFEQAQKKGAVAVMTERCGAPSSVYFPNATAEGIARTAAALREGETRMLELYPDGTVKAR
jgi:hypothetical protein